MCIEHAHICGVDGQYKHTIHIIALPQLQTYFVTLLIHQFTDNNIIEGAVSRGLTSHSTLYRSFRGRFLQAR